jgi:tetratricopeptide (TPR) repeat protein
MHVFYELQELNSYSRKEIKRRYLHHEDTTGFIENYYSKIESTYGLTLSYRKSDIIFVPLLIQRWGEPDELISYCNKHLEKNPKIWQLYFYRGQYYEKLKSNKKALENYEEGYKLMLIEDETLNTSDYEDDLTRVKKKISKE